MPVHFLSQHDHEKLNQCPGDLTFEDLSSYFQLTREDFELIRSLRGNVNRFGVALSLCCLRFLGFFPSNLLSLDEVIIDYVSYQLGVSNVGLTGYAAREATQHQHQRQIIGHLGFRRPSPMDILALEQWLLERALEHNRPKRIFELACDYLREHKIVRLGTVRLAEMVSTARSQAELRTYEQLHAFLTPERRQFLDDLLTTDDERRLTRLTWLQRTPQSNRAAAIVQTIDKIALLYEAGIPEWDLSVINPNRRKWLAKRTSRSRLDNLGNLSEQTRYPLLAAFVEEALYTFTDALVEMVDARLWELHSKCRNQFKKDRLNATNTISNTLAVLKALAQTVLKQRRQPSNGTALQDIDVDQIEEAVSKADTLIRPEDDAYVDYFSKKHQAVQNFSKRLLEVMCFYKNVDDKGLLEGLRLIHDIHAGNRRKLPSSAPTAFVPGAWVSEVFTGEGLNWRSYEIAALWVLRESLRSGDIYVQHSRRYLQLEAYLIPKSEWAQQRLEIPGLLGIVHAAEPYLQTRKDLFDKLASRVHTRLEQGDETLRWDGERLILLPISVDDEPPSLTELRRQVDKRLEPRDITDILIEVDNWTGFSDAFTHLDGVAARDKGLLTQLYACILAQACNLGFRQMAHSTDLPYRKLLWCNRWYLRDATLDAAVTKLVNYHHSLPMSDLWGSGVLSSSDGQRFPVRGDTRKARSLPRYFGYGKGITSYTWTSDQFSQFGSKVIPATMREATYVLDALLDNETDLDIAEHTTDTSGFTEIIFALFTLLGYTFSPRLRDLSNQQLYRPQTFDLSTTPLLRKSLTQRVHEARITGGWDEMLRVVMSLKKGYCTASTLIQKLQAYPRKHPVARTLQELGRLEKTLHILRWYSDIDTRKRISKQLNKGENLHFLRAAIAFGKHGIVDGKEDEPLEQQFACLNLVTNAVLIYNTVQISKVVDDLKREGHTVNDEDLARIWPSRHGHINFIGKYHFATERIRPDLM